MIKQIENCPVLLCLSLVCMCVLAATPLGVITVPGDSDLETCRLLIERLHDNLDQVRLNRTRH